MRRVLACLLLVAACSSEAVLAPAPGFTEAIARFTCAPSSEAVEIILSRTPAPPNQFFWRPPPPYLRIIVFQDVSTLEGLWSLGLESPDGFATLHRGSESERVSGVVRVKSVLQGNRVQGSIDLLLPVLGQVRGGFDAPYLPFPSNLPGCD